MLAVRSTASNCAARRHTVRTSSALQSLFFLVVVVAATLLVGCVVAHASESDDSLPRSRQECDSSVETGDQRPCSPEPTSGAAALSTDSAAVITSDAAAASDAPPRLGDDIAAPLDRPAPSRVAYIDAIAALYAEKNLTKAVQLLQVSADGGESRAMWILAVLHANGVGVTRSEAKAILYHTFAAMGGAPESHAALSFRYQHGIGVATDCEKALFHARAVADAVAASYHEDIVPIADTNKLSDLPYPRSNRRSRGFGIVSYVLGAAHGGNAPHTTGGQANRHGHLSDEELVQLHTYKGESGSQTSLMFLAYAYMYGSHGLRQDLSRAMHYLDLAAKANVPAAHGALGQIYLRGLKHPTNPILPDKKRAFESFKRGAAARDVVSMNGLGYLYAVGVPGVVERDMNAAFRYFEEASNVNNAEATYNLAIMHLNGKGGAKQDIVKAFTLLMRANVGESPLASWQLGHLYRAGVPGVVPKSCPAALQAYRSVIERGSWSKLLGTAREAYEQGDYFASFIDYLLAAETGFRSARWNAAYLVDEELVHVAERDDDEFTAGSVSLLRRAGDAGQLLSGRRAAESLVFSLMRRSAAEGDYDAHVKVADAYYYGTETGVPDYAKAKEHYRIAATGGNAQARFNLGLQHQFHRHATDDPAVPATQADGRDNNDAAHLEEDFHLAKRYYDQAMEANPHAFIAVRAALMSLNFHWWLRHYGEKDGPLLNNELMRSVGRGFGRWVTSYVPSLSSLSWLVSWEPFGVPLEDLVLRVSLMLLGVLLLLRNYIVHR